MICTKPLDMGCVVKRGHKRSVSEKRLMFVGCYGLDLRYPSKAHILKAWSSACGACGRWCKLLQVGPCGRKKCHWGGVLFIGGVLEGILKPWPLPFFLCFLAARKRAGLLCHALSP